MALVLAPEKPIGDWIVELDGWLQRSPGFFAGRPVILDISGISFGKPDLANLLADLHERGIRIMGIEGTDPAWLSLGMPPLVSNGRQAGVVEVLDLSANDSPKDSPEAASLLVESPVRSGQSVIFPQGDVTVVGSVGSGAEVIAGGSIHIYGALRGRASAGSSGDAQARIFCSKFEAELLAIDGLYATIDDIEPRLRGKPVQAWLDRTSMKIMMIPLN
jgi:septum site-determining protein MinC